MGSNNGPIVIYPSDPQNIVPPREVEISTEEAAREILSAESWVRFENSKNLSRTIVILTMLICATLIVVVMLILNRPIAEIVAISTSMPAALGLLTHLSASQMISKKIVKEQNSNG